MRDHGSRESEHALEKHVHHAIPDLVTRLVQRAGVQEASRVVDEHVDATEGGQRRLHRVLDVGLHGDTARHGQRVAAGRGDLVRDLAERLLAPARDRHLGSFVRERCGNGRAYSRPAPRHDGYFVCESHQGLPSR